ncbi:hypothetical protein [Legionella sainthelensi]|uniref:Uncharacterized protein n=1 Tax=Legionella sainthelensi TaxID=28087 RepID=A0A2H5FNU5_9GAMM|nr:hypothetical protein [Legionella sainthelensi]AUH73235.1 hypothetical protein CAB17_15130 [Legionella sainthelensi]
MKLSEERDYYKNMLEFTNELLNMMFKAWNEPASNSPNSDQLTQNSNTAQNNQLTQQNTNVGQQIQPDSDGPQLGQLSSVQTNTTPRDLNKASETHDDLLNANTSENDSTNVNDNTNTNDSTNSFSFQ